MTRRTRTIAGAAVGVAALVVAYLGYERMYARPRAEVEGTIRQSEADIAAREQALDDMPGLHKRLVEMSATTLGTDEETVSAALRTALNEIVAHFDLRDPSVATRKPEGVRNPSVLKVSDFTDRAAKARPDFYTVEATLRAAGSLEAVLRTLATLEKQPWVHRIDRWAIMPLDKGRERFEFTVELTSAYLPERELRARVEGEKAWEAIGEEQFALYRPILARAVFKAPAPEAAPPPVRVADVNAPPPAPAYDEWKVTGLERGREGWEMLVKNNKSGQSLRLMAGDRVLDAKFVEAAGELATVEIGGARYVVMLGQTLGDRRPKSQ